MQLKKTIMLILTLFLLHSCKEDNVNIDRIWDFELKSGDIHGIWAATYCNGVSLDDYYLADDESKYKRLVELRKDGTGTIFICKAPDVIDSSSKNNEPDKITTIDINYSYDNKSVTIDTYDNSSTWTFGDYYKKNTLNTVYKQNGSNPYDYNNFDIYRLEEIRTDSALYDYCLFVSGIMNVPADRVWKDKTIVGYYSCGGCYFHFKENGEVSRMYRHQVVNGTYELREESGVDYLSVVINDAKTEGVVVFDSTSVFVYSPNFADILFELNNYDTKYRLYKHYKPVEGL